MAGLPPPQVPRPAEPNQPRRHLRNALVLLLVAPVVAEGVASYNTPGYLIPVLLPLLALIYGVPALLIRELWVRERIGRLGAGLLAIVYGALNEGVIAATWSKLDADDEVLVFTAEQAGRSDGLNLNLIVNLSVFHAFWSILIPIVLVEGWSRTGRGRPWLPRWAVIWSSIAIAVVMIGSISDESMTTVCEASTSQIFDECVRGRRLSAALIVVLVVIALLLPRRRRPRKLRDAPTPGRRTLLLVGAGFYVTFLITFFALPLNDQPTPSIVLTVAFALLALGLIRRWSRTPGWDTRAAVTLATGALIPGMVASVLRVVVLQPVIVLAFVVLFLRPTWRRLAASAEIDQGAGRQPPR